MEKQSEKQGEKKSSASATSAPTTSEPAASNAPVPQSPMIPPAPEGSHAAVVMGNKHEGEAAAVKADAFGELPAPRGSLSNEDVFQREALQEKAALDRASQRPAPRARVGAAPGGEEPGEGEMRYQVWEHGGVKVANEAFPAGKMYPAGTYLNLHPEEASQLVETGVLVMASRYAYNACPVCGPGGTNTKYPCSVECFVKAGYLASEYEDFVKAAKAAEAKSAAR